MHTLFRRKYLSIVLRYSLILVFFFIVIFVFTFSICISFIFIFVLKFLCLVCWLGGARVGAENLAVKAPDCERGALIPCVVAVKKKYTKRLDNDSESDVSDSTNNNNINNEQQTIEMINLNERLKFNSLKQPSTIGPLRQNSSNNNNNSGSRKNNIIIMSTWRNNNTKIL